MQNLLNQLMAGIDLWIIAIVLCSGFFQKKYFQGFKISKDPSYDSALKTLALSFVVSLIYIYLVKDPAKSSNWSKYFFSYFGATSLYELLVSPFIDWIKKVTGQKTDTENKP
jgi:hypothetical protein